MKVITPPLATKKILILHTAFLGDLLLAIPFFVNLKKLYPQFVVELICRKHIGEFFLKTGLVDKIYEIKKGDSQSYKEVQYQVDKNFYELFVCPHKSLRSYFFSLKIKSARKITYKTWFNFLGFSDRIARDLALPEAFRVMQLLLPLSAELTDKFNQLKLTNYNIKNQNRLLPAVPLDFSLDLTAKLQSDDFSFYALKKKLELPDKNDKWICVFPGSVWETKKWSLENYKTLVGLLLQNNFSVLLMGAPGEQHLCNEIFNKFNSSEKRIYNYCGQTSVYESALIMLKSDIVIGNDSASSHLAAVCNKKLITFFGPTVLGFGYRPWGNSIYVFENENLKCRPCGPHGHHKCPLGTHECMSSITPYEVLKLILSIV